MAARWLVTVALFLVSNPADAARARIELANHKITTSRAALAQLHAPQLARIPSSVRLEDDDVLVTTRDGIVRHPLAHGGAGASWLVPVGPRLVIGAADRSHDRADTLFAIDLATGAVTWRRALASLFAARLAGDLLVVERSGALEVIDARTGTTHSTAAIDGHSIRAVCRAGNGDLHVKTRGDLVAIAPDGVVRWTRPSTSSGTVAVTAGAVVDGWVDRVGHRFGIVSYDRATGRPLGSLDLGSTHGWYDFDRVTVAPDGPDEVLVSALFAVE
jgi:outer membrane protein assembly factor BamB